MQHLKIHIAELGNGRKRQPVIVRYQDVAKIKENSFHCHTSGATQPENSSGDRHGQKADEAEGTQDTQGEGDEECRTVVGIAAATLNVTAAATLNRRHLGRDFPRRWHDAGSEDSQQANWPRRQPTPGQRQIKTNQLRRNWLLAMNAPALLMR
jgi:hypothetical protein